MEFSTENAIRIQCQAQDAQHPHLCIKWLPHCFDLLLKVTDLHRHFIDGLTIPSKTGRGPLRRVDEVFDCWFESGSMPYAYLHYPFENKELFENNFPADFVAEG